MLKQKMNIEVFNVNTQKHSISALLSSFCIHWLE